MTVSPLATVTRWIVECALVPASPGTQTQQTIPVVLYELVYPEFEFRGAYRSHPGDGRATSRPFVMLTNAENCQIASPLS